MPRTRILIVEDEGIIARDVQRQLLDLGYEPVGLAVSGREAVAHAEALRPHLVLMDIHLAGAMDGIEAAVIIRERFSIPCVFLTAYATDEIVERAKRALPLGYIIKPFDEQGLRTTIEIALHKDTTDRALRISESRYRAVVQSAHDAVVTTDSAGTIVGWSPSASTIFGYAEAEVIGQPITMLMPAPDREPWLAELRKAGSDGKQAAFNQVREVVACRKDGRTLVGELSLARWETAEGWFVTGMFRDISERRQNEERLRIANAVVSRSSTVLFRWRAEEGWPVAYVSENVERQFGYAADDLVSGRVPFARLLHPDDAARVAREVAEYTARGTNPFAQEFRLVTKDGDTRWVDDRTVVERSDTGQVLWYEGVLQDITEQRQAAASLRLQSAALNAAANAIVITDRDGAIQWVNPAFTVMSGYSAEEAIGKNPRELVRSGTHASGFYQQMWDTLNAGQVWEGELINRRKDDSRYTEGQTITPVKDAAGAITHFVGVKRDLTDHKRLQEQFLQAQKMEVVGRLAAGVAHDFNNLLTVINGTADLALLELPEHHPLRADFGHIQNAGDRAARLTRQLLAISRKQLLAPVRVNLSTHVSNMTDLLRRLIGEDITLTVDVQRDLDSVMIDPAQLEQVLLNLAVNARDAMPGGGSLTIATRSIVLSEAFAAEHAGATPGPHVMMAVTDTGTGMTAEVKRRLFEPFFTTKEQGKGTGLGLATVYGIVQQSGGCILVDSEPGQGSTFTIFLPGLTSDQPGLAAAPKAPVRGTETILVVEDEDGLRELAVRMLQSAGYRVLAARGGQQALALLQNHDGHVDLVFTDVVMPGMSGWDLVATITAAHPEIKALFASGYSDDTRQGGAMPAPVRNFVAKPYTVAGLTRQIRDILHPPAAPV